jgi:hypothetical protein
MAKEPKIPASDPAGLAGADLNTAGAAPIVSSSQYDRPVDTFEPVPVPTISGESATDSAAIQEERAQAAASNEGFAEPPRAPGLAFGERYQSFEDFYPYYISQHQNDMNRRLHVVGTGLALLALTQVVMWGLVGGFGYLVLAAVFGYGFAWVGHYVFEKNEPATFKYPAWSLMGDFKMAWEVVSGKRAW